MTSALFVATWLVPLGMLAACLLPSARAHMLTLLWIAPLPALAAAGLADEASPLVFDGAQRRLTLDPDSAGRLLLGVTALLWIAAGVYARSYLREDPKAPRFAEWWLATMTGSLGVFLAADLFTFYIAFALASLPAWGLVVHDDTAPARRASAIYLGLAVVAEIALLLGFALLAAGEPSESLAIRDVLAALPTAPGRGFTIALLVVGFGLKAGLVPLHVWLPLAHPAAPMPASAVLSGALIKAGVIGFLRFLPLDPALTGWGTGLAALGFLTAFYAVGVGITQSNPKTVLAYSSVSQMGGVTAILGMALASGDTAGVSAASFAAAHHVLIKGALFLAVGVAAVTGRRRRRIFVLVPAVVLSLSLGGFPLTGGAFVKLAAKASMAGSFVAMLAALSAAGTTLLMLHFVSRLVRISVDDPHARAPLGLLVPWLVLAAAAIAVPWALAATFVGVTGADVVQPKALGDALWPIGVGVALALVLRRFVSRMPRVPEGDLIVLGAPAARRAGVWADALERVERNLREWPVAGVSLLALAILLVAILARSGAGG